MSAMRLACLLLLVSDFSVVMTASCGSILPGTAVGTADQYTSMIVNPHPLIVYQASDVTTGFRVAACADARCAVVNNTNLNSLTIHMGSRPEVVSRNTTNGAPWVTYHCCAETYPYLYWFNCADAACSTGTSGTRINLNWEVVGGMSVLGTPMVFGSNWTTSGPPVPTVIRSLRCTTPACGAFIEGASYSTSPPVTYGVLPAPLQFSATVTADGYPFFVYRDYSTGKMFTIKNNVTSTSFGINAHCGTSVTLSNLGYPLIAYCDGVDLRVYACLNVACTNATKSPVLVAGIATPPPSPPYQGMTINIATRPCGSGFPVLAYSGFLYGELAVFDCADANCTTGTNRILYTNGTFSPTLVVPPVGNFYEGMPMISYSMRNGSNTSISLLVCFDGTCASCSATAPQPTEPYVTPCNNPFNNQTLPPTEAPTTPPATTSVSTTPPIPLGPCGTNDCGVQPTIGTLALFAVCCSGQWVIQQNTSYVDSGTAPTTVLEIFQGGDVIINYTWNYTIIQNLIIHIDGAGNKRQSSAVARVKVNGDAFVNGPLEIVLDSIPQPSLDTTPISVVAIIPSSGGNLTGQFVEPIKVTLGYANDACSSGSASQNANSVGISALVSVDSKKCKGGSKGLSTNAKVAIGVVCGVVGLLLLLLIGFLLIKAFAPETAVKVGIAKSSSIEVGKSYSHRKLSRGL